jgi:hypothetical protein
MKTEYQIASAILNYVTSFREVTNSPFEIQQIRDEVDSLRIRMITELDRAGMLRRPYTQFSQQITVPVSRDNNRNVMYAPIPPLHCGDDGKPKTAYVGGTLGDSEYRVVIGNQLANVESLDPWLRNMKTVHYGPARLTFKNDAPDKTLVDGIFTKPSSLAIYGYNWKTDWYPVTGAMADEIIGKTQESYRRAGYSVPVQPNTQSDLTVRGK